ncbi:MAG: hypothetical protein FWC65_02340, partial [Treponema sp.]|nr:hypothetical protein [Treponema sp.]
MSISQGIFLKRQVIAIGLILAAGIVFAIGMVNPHIEHHEFYPTYQAAFPPAEEFVPSRAEQVARALVKAYPRRILRAEYRDGDWAV